MISQKMKLEIAAVMAFTTVLSGVCVYGGQKENAQEEPGAVQTADLTAGIRTVLNTENQQTASVTSGVTDLLNDFSYVGVVDTDTSLVAAAKNEGAEGQSDEEALPEELCGYSNIGVAVLSDGKLNVRANPSTDSEIVGKMADGDVCEILSTDGEWSSISSGNVEGYVKNEYLMSGKEALERAKGELRTVAEVQTDSLRVRAAASTESEILSVVQTGQDLAFVADHGDWIEVEADGGSGYVSAEYVSVSDKLPTAKTISELRFGDGVSDVRSSLVSYACQFIGNRYVWGGTSLTNGVDCSGFTMQIYARYGVYLPHSSRAQPGYGTKISASEAQPGDLFFYGSGRYISHVAIYIGNGQIVHASDERGGIKISNAYYSRPICVVRYL